MSLKILKGSVVYSESEDKLTVHENNYIIIREGVVDGIYTEVPEKYSGFPISDYGRSVIIPAFSDLHVHASQYVQRGIGMDLMLEDWLNTYTFPQEARFKDLNYAKSCYDAFVDDLIRHGTFHSSIFATIHREATNYLYDKLVEKGLYGYVGKVNMDRNSPDCLLETTNESLHETEKFLDEHKGSGRVKPIITPRFAPTCSKELLDGLGNLARKYNCGLQTHLVESQWESREALKLFPSCSCDAEIYEKSGLLEYGPSIFAHVIFPRKEDIRVLKKYNSISVHCPDATTNIIAGIMPLAYLEKQGMRIAIGSDIAGGHGIAVYRQIARAIQLSKLKEFYEPQKNKSISFAQAFYHGTKSGGSVFGKIGSLEKGYLFNALVINNIEDSFARLSPVERLERFCYIGDDRNIVARFINGDEI